MLNILWDKKIIITGIFLLFLFFPFQQAAATPCGDGIVDIDEQCDEGTLKNIGGISAGINHTCAFIAGGGNAYCWGDNLVGQLGNGTTGGSKTTPSKVKDPSGTGYLSGVIGITSGNYFSCALTDSGYVYCWGYNQDGQLGINNTTNSSLPVQVKGVGGASVLSNVSKIDSHWNHVCAVTADKKAYCWGANTSNQLGDNTSMSRSTPVPVKDALGTGVLFDVAQITAGINHTCAITTTGAAYCWGANASGQLGLNHTSNRSLPTPVQNPSGGGNWVTVAGIDAGNEFTCAYSTVSGAAFCWGNGLYGKLGNNSTANMTMPVTVQMEPSGALTNVTKITAGSKNACAIIVGGATYCWGDNAYGQIGNNTTSPAYKATQVKDTPGTGTLADVVGISSGDGHACAYTTGGLGYCWGHNTNGKLGDNTGTHRHTPVRIKGPDFGVPCDPGSAYGSSCQYCGALSCAWITVLGPHCGDPTVTLGYEQCDAGSSGNVPPAAKPVCSTYNSSCSYCDSSCQNAAVPGPYCGDGTTNSPTEACDPGSFNVRGTCGVNNKTHEAYCWGYNNKGQVGNGLIENVAVTSPSKVRNPSGTGYLSNVAEVVSNGSHSCAYTTTGELYCWGDNWMGQLGDNTYQNQKPLPVRVLHPSGSGYLTGVIGVTVGFYTTCAYTSPNGNLYCWGRNDWGQLGDNTTIERHLPVQVVGEGGVSYLTGVTGIHSETNFTCAVSNTQVYCWGRNINGYTLGINNSAITQSNTPMKVVGVGGTGYLSGMSDVNIGYSFSVCAYALNGNIYCWGANDAGYLGDGTITNRNAPVKVVGGAAGTPYLTNVVSYSDGCAATLDGKIYCWGYNGSGFGIGILGDGTNVNRSSPVAILGSGGTGTLSGVTRVNKFSNKTCANIGTKTYCWGSNTNGLIGNGNTTATAYPTETAEINPATKPCTATTYNSFCQYCNNTCTTLVTVQGPRCGDTITQTAPITPPGADEQCDNGDSSNVPATPAPVCNTYGGSCTYCTTITCQNLTIQGPRCGDNAVQSANGEQCDGSVSIGCTDATFSAQGFTGGTLSCYPQGGTPPGATNQCTYNTSSCIKCGNGIRETGETCDQSLANTPTGDPLPLNDGDGCQANCQSVTPGWTCTGNIGEASVCTLNCGNGIIDSGEGCDDNNSTAQDGCTACVVDTGYSCQAVANTSPKPGSHSVCTLNCGDGQSNEPPGGCDYVLTPTGVCTTSGGYAGTKPCIGPPATAPNACTFGACASLDFCGDGKLNGPETSPGGCDDANATTPGCDTACKAETGYVCSNPNGLNNPSVCEKTCGNGKIDPPGEICDPNPDGPSGTNTTATQACTTTSGYPGTRSCLDTCAGYNSSCTTTLSCGDSQVTSAPDGPEQCEGSTTQDCLTSVDGIGGYAGTQTCSSCRYDGVECITTEYCGDHIVNGDEGCDYDTAGSPSPHSDDGCSSTCITEPGFFCSKTAPYNCVFSCGNGGEVQSSAPFNEECDYAAAGKEIPSADPVVGRGLFNGEVCTLAGYGTTCNWCSMDCKNKVETGEFCGDSIKNGAEKCDDGNYNNFDGCTACEDGGDFGTDVQDGNIGCSQGCKLEFGYVCTGTSCQTVCGDGACANNPDESCVNCPSDCNPCPIGQRPGVAQAHEKITATSLFEKIKSFIIQPKLLIKIPGLNFETPGTQPVYIPSPETKRSYTFGEPTMVKIGDFYYLLTVTQTPDGKINIRVE